MYLSVQFTHLATSAPYRMLAYMRDDATLLYTTDLTARTLTDRLNSREDEGASVVVDGGALSAASARRDNTCLSAPVTGEAHAAKNVD